MVKFLPFPTDVAKILEENDRAKSALRRQEVGTPPTKRSWFYEDKEPDWILGQVEDHLAGMREFKQIAEWDLSKKDKFQPQGETAPFDMRLESFEEYFKHLDPPPVTSDKIFKKAMKIAVTRLKLNGNLEPLSCDEVVKRGLADQKYGTSSGYPLFLKRKNPKAIEEAISSVETRRCFSDKYPFTVGSRAQMGKVRELARFIFMASMGVNLFGMRFSQPLQDHLRIIGEPFFLPWDGWNAVQQEISQRWHEAPVRFGADYTKMDQHFNIHHGKVVFEVIKHAFNKQYWDDLWESISYVFRAPVLTPKGYVDQEHALLSGSEWTNLIETVWNYVFILYLNLKYGIKFLSSMGIGDDQLWFVTGITTSAARKWLLKTVIREFETAGLPGNAEKQDGIEDPETSAFLQRKMWTNYNGPDDKVVAAGVYSLVRNVTSQVYPERYFNAVEWDKYAFAIRVIMIAENCVQHPIFEWYVKDFIANANENILEFVSKSSNEMESIFHEKKNIAGFIPSYNQEKQDMGISSFETVKMLKSLI